MLYSPAPADTLAHWLKGQPLTAYLNRSNATVYDTVAALKGTGWFGNNVSPDVSAVHFYLLNHAASVIAQRRDPLEPLPPEERKLLQLYVDMSTPIAARLFYYILLITTREARHNQSSVSAKLSVVQSEVKKAHPEVSDQLVKDMFEFTKSCSDSSAILGHMLVQATKNFPLGPYLKTVSALFYKCSWSSAFGGKKWGNIADAGHAMATGQWSAEMLADTAFTLAHNGGPMFNKGMLYTGIGGQFLTILDCQRAGMVPQWLMHEGGQFIDATVNQVQAVLPEMFEGPLDWSLVQKLGALGHYGHKVKSAPAKPMVPSECQNKLIAVDHQTMVWVLKSRAKAA